MLGLITAPLLLAGVVVLGEGRDGCPSAAEVSARLQPLLADDSGDPPDALILDGASGPLRVRLLSAEGALREEKTLDLHGTCDELADAVATLGVTWRSRLQAHQVPPPVLPAVEVVQLHDREDPISDPPRGHDFELSVGLETQSGAERWAPALVLGAQLPISGPYNFGLMLDLAAPRSAFDTALQRWSWVQGSVMAAVSRRTITRTVYFDLQLGLGAGVNVTLNKTSELRSPRLHLVPPTLISGVRWTYRHAQRMPWFGITWSLGLDPRPASPVKSTDIPAERWLLGLALGGTLGLDDGR